MLSFFLKIDYLNCLLCNCIILQIWYIYMNNEKVKIIFWEDKNGFCPVIDFLENKLSKKFYLQIIKKIDIVISSLTFDELLQDKDRLTILSEYKIKPFQPYELKFKSQAVRIVSYRENNNLILVEAVKGTFSDKKTLKKAVEAYKKRVC